MKWYEVIQRRVSWKEVTNWAGHSMEDVIVFDDIVSDASIIMTDAPYDSKPHQLSSEVIHLLEPFSKC